MPGQFMPQQQNQFGQPVQMQPTGFGGPFNPGQQQFGMAPPPGANLNSMLPPALEPQRTAMPTQQQQTMQPMQPQPTGPFTQGFGNHGMAPTPTPLLPQQTGPAPPVRFGVTEETKKLMPQATGRRANLSAASKFTRLTSYKLKCFLLHCFVHHANKFFSSGEPVRFLIRKMSSRRRHLVFGFLFLTHFLFFLLPLFSSLRLRPYSSPRFKSRAVLKKKRERVVVLAIDVSVQQASCSSFLRPFFA